MKKLFMLSLCGLICSDLWASDPDNVQQYTKQLYQYANIVNENLKEMQKILSNTLVNNQKVKKIKVIVDTTQQQFQEIESFSEGSISDNEMIEKENILKTNRELSPISASDEENDKSNTLFLNNIEREQMAQKKLGNENPANKESNDNSIVQQNEFINLPSTSNEKIYDEDGYFLDDDLRAAQMAINRINDYAHRGSERKAVESALIYLNHYHSELNEVTPELKACIEMLKDEVKNNLDLCGLCCSIFALIQ